MPKYSRPEGSTPTYNMDTDISTLEAPTFTTLSHGPSHVLQALKWDHKSALVGTKVVNPILHVCDKCQHPIIRYGRLTCKHVLCHNCASTLHKETLVCIRCGGKVTSVEEVGLGRLFVCSFGGSRYGSDGCRRTYLSERDLNAHVDFRHLKQTPQPAATAAATNTTLPSVEAINAATAALAASNEGPTVVQPRGKIRPQQTGPSFTQNQFSQPPPPVMAANRGAASSNLITVPIQDSNTSAASGNNANEYWTSKVPIHQPPPNYYARPHQASQSSHHHYAQVPSGSYNDWTRTASGYRR